MDEKPDKKSHMKRNHIGETLHCSWAMASIGGTMSGMTPGKLYIYIETVRMEGVECTAKTSEIAVLDCRRFLFYLLNSYPGITFSQIMSL